VNLVFVESSDFSQILADYFGSDEAYRNFQEHLMRTPTEGKVIQGSGGLRKLRWIDPRRGKGKRGGLRVLYLYVPEVNKLALLDIYDKDEKEDLTASERRVLAGIAETIRRSFEERRPKK
jgi:hypothetical protein